MAGEAVSGTGENVEGERPEPVEGVVEDEATVDEAEGVELERTLGLVGGLAIGIGTMIGAGIFVFPGIAAGRAGPAAAASFAIGAVVALLVALPASELATAMPRSGGGYYFISRGLGTMAGAMVGISLWLGLVFASAFYLMGFGSYAIAVFAEMGVTAGPTWRQGLALAFGAGLVGIGVTGTENVTKLQSLVVGVLVLILTLFLGYGGLDALGVFGSTRAPEVWIPFGYGPIVTTAALVFTSYLGFAQVATVAGEIRRPGRNLPIAMVGSVIIVGVFYVATILVATSAVSSGALAGFGETAMVEVARRFIGSLGAIAILIAGLLATVSSANASILSSSRALYALSRDALVPRRASTVNLRYGTPHVAIVLAGGPVLVLVALGRVTILAEVASFLHLVMYGLICVALVVLRREPPPWYDPDFRTPGYPAVPVLGALASFGLILFMQPLSQLIRMALLVAAAAWYFTYARDVHLKGAL